MKCKTLLLPLLAGLALGATNAYARNPETKTPVNLASKSLSFTENKGQIINQFQQPRPDIDFRLSAGNGLSVFVGSGQIHYQWAKSVKGSGQERLIRTGGPALGDALSAPEDIAPATYQLYRMDVQLLGANPQPQVVKEQPQGYYERYYLPGMPQGAKANSFGKVTYKDVYPDIDWVFYFNATGQLEYDFLVRPGGNPADIKIKYAGAEQLALNSDGSLSAATPLGKISEQAPYSYDGQGRAVASRFRLEGDVVSFAVGHYSGTLTIDPTVEWATYFGGTSVEAGRGIALDDYGHVYMAGTTGSSGNIATTGAYQTTYGGSADLFGGDAFLSKWDTAGNLLWATYYGGTGIDVAKGAGCDSSGNIYMGGYTRSKTGVATTGSYQETKAGIASRYDAFIVKFDSTGQRIWGTYYGGTNTEGGDNFLGFTCDKSGNSYITGRTTSSSGIATNNAYQSTIAGTYDAFLAKFDSSGQLSWGTYFGGTGEDDATCVTYDSVGNIYLSGYTFSADGIATTNAYQTTLSGASDAFLAKFDSSGQRLWSTYYGGTGIEKGFTISCNQGKVFIGGSTSSTEGIASTNAYDTSNVDNNQGDGYLATFDDSGNFLWGTYYGGDMSDAITGIFNKEESVYISGPTASTNDIADTNALQSTLNGWQNFFVAKFSSDGERKWGTYYGGDNTDGYFTSIIGDSESSLYLTDVTNSDVGIATTGAYQTALSGDYDACLIKFNICDAPEVPGAISGDTEVCASSEHLYTVPVVTGADHYNWILPNGWTGTSTTDSINITNDGSNGTLQVAAVSACGAVSDTASLSIVVMPVPAPVIINNNNVLSTSQPFTSYQWIMNGQDITGATAATYTPTADGDYRVRVSNSDGCSGTSDTLTITGVNGILEVGRDSFNIYPNPAKDYLIINSPIIAKAIIYRTDGRVAMKGITLKVGLNEIRLKGLSSGIYWLQIQTDSDVQTTKVILK